MQESGPGLSDIHSVLNPNINRSSGFINKNQTQLYKSKMYVRLWVTQPWQWDIFHTTLTPDIGSKKTFTPSHCLNESHTPSEKSKQKPTNLAHVQTVLQADNFYPLITDILQKNKQYPKNTKKNSQRSLKTLLQIWPTCTAPLRSMRSPREEVELYSLVAKLS